MTCFVNHSPEILVCVPREQFTIYSYIYLVSITTTRTARETQAAAAITIKSNQIKAIRALTLDHVWVVNFFKCMLRRRSAASSLNDVDCMRPLLSHLTEKYANVCGCTSHCCNILMVIPCANNVKTSL